MNIELTRRRIDLAYRLRLNAVLRGDTTTADGLGQDIDRLVEFQVQLEDALKTRVNGRS